MTSTGRTRLARTLFPTLFPRSAPTLGLAPALVLAWALALAVAGPAVAGNCVGTNLDPTSAATGPFDVAGLEAVGDDLHVTLRGPAGAQVLVQVMDADGSGVGAELGTLADAGSEVGSVVLVMDDNLRTVFGRGPQHELKLLDPDTGETLGREPFRVRLQCPEAAACTWQVTRDVSASSPITDAALLAALDESGDAQESDDVLGRLLDERPDLRGALLDLSWQLDTAPEPGDGGAGTGAETDCRCRWIAWVDTPRVFGQGGVQGTPPLQVHQRWNGAKGFLTFQMTSGSFQSQLAPRSTEAGFHLLCHRTTGYRFVDVELGDGTARRLQVPLWKECPAPCTAEIGHLADVDLCTEARAFGTDTSPTTAGLLLQSSFSVDGVHVSTSNAQVHGVSASHSGQTFLDSHSGTVLRSVQGLRSASQITVSGAFENHVTAAQSEPAYLFAAASSRPELFLTGHAACAETPWVELLLGGTGSGGGTLIERWGDPP